MSPKESKKPLEVPEAVAQKILWYPAASYNVTTTDSWKVTLLLSEFICLSETLVEPVNIVATPSSADRPSFVTVQHELVNDSNDVEMTFWTWNPDGTAAPETSFDWRCRVPYWQIIL